MWQPVSISTRYCLIINLNELSKTKQSSEGDKSMFISDLSYLEVVTEDNRVEGGSKYFFYSSAKAKADADALAFGQKTSTYADTKTFAAPGVSASSSSSGSSSSGFYFPY